MGRVQSLYETLLGPDWNRLDPAIRLAHRGGVNRRGRLRLVRGGGLVNRVLAALLRLPRQQEAADTTLRVTTAGNAEAWERNFDRRRVLSRQSAVGGALAERVGLLEFRFVLSVDKGSLVFRQIAVTCMLGRFRLPIPRGMGPHIVAREDPAGADAVRIHVELSTAAGGRLLTYEGVVGIESSPA